MSIRSNTLPPRWDLSHGFRDILMRNGMQAHIVSDTEGLKLLVKGHDSPYMSYRISPEQFKALTDWGVHSANKKAYNTFADIVGENFTLPRSYVHAQHANGRVVMGLHGYRLDSNEPYHVSRHHRAMMPIFGRGFLGWTPRNQPGYHLHRHGGALFVGSNGPIVPDRINGHMKPGELQSGAYGFYWKGNQQTPAEKAQYDVLSELEAVVSPKEVPVRQPKAEAKPYNELITSPVYFTNEKFQECLSSHGLVLDTESKSLTVISEGATHDFVYKLTDQEISKLTDNSLSTTSLQERLNLLNDIIKEDFAEPITMDALKSKSAISIKLHPEIEQDLNAREAENIAFGERYTESVVEKPAESIHIDGNSLYSLNENKAWYRNVEHGREVQVDDIFAEKTREGTYRMTAVINGISTTRDITQKQYEKFAAIDDYHRLKMFDKIFDDVKMKTIPGKGFNLLAALTAGVVAAGEVAGAIHHHRHHPSPEIYESHHLGPAPRIFYKPGVDTPESIAARAFDLGRNSAELDCGRHR